MSQDINLLHRQKIRVHSPIKVARLFLLSGMLVLGAATLKTAIGFYQIYSLESEYDQAQSVFSDKKTQLDNMKKLAKQASDPQTLLEFVELEERLKQIQRTRDILEADKFSNAEGYSAFFKAFAEQSVRGLWLTNIEIIGAGEQITLEGNCTDPALLPKYIKRLAESETIDGTLFNGLRINRPEATTAKFVQFVITTNIEALTDL